jgi:hypothetical protein
MSATDIRRTKSVERKSVANFMAATDLDRRRAGAGFLATATRIVHTSENGRHIRALDPHAQPSSVIRHVLVNGTFVVRDSRLDINARPGRPVRA